MIAKRKRTRKEERLIALVKKHKAIHITFSFHNSSLPSRERVLFDDGTAFYRHGPEWIWRAPCWIGNHSEYKQKYLKRGIRRTVRSMLAHDLRSLRILEVKAGDGGVPKDLLRNEQVS